MSTKQRYAHTVEARNVLNSFDLYRSSEILLARGASRRNPIHYAAEYGMAHVCEDLIKASLTHVKTRADLGAIWAMIAPDNEGLTPLHLAVTGNFTDIAICIIEAVLSHDRFALEFHRKAKEIMGEALQIAIKSQNIARRCE
jgi:ankyrin repeat protein